MLVAFSLSPRREGKSYQKHFFKLKDVSPGRDTLYRIIIIDMTDNSFMMFHVSLSNAEKRIYREKQF